MKKPILIYGAIAGFVIITVNTVSFEMGIGAEWLGYLVMFIAFGVIFLAVKQYRDDLLGGVIRFKSAFLLGLGITLVASLVYVLVWEAYLALTGHAFIDTYIASLVENRRAAGATDAELAATVAEMEVMREQYANPLFRVPVTFMEIFPVGLLVSLVAAFILRNSKALAAR